MQEIRRVLKPQGRFYLVDFGRFKLRSTQHFFANDLRQSAQFTDDYRNSLRAAFSVAELSEAAAPLQAGMRRHVTLLAPFMVVLRSAHSQPLDAPTLQRARQEFSRLSTAQQNNFRSLAGWFKLGGYSTPCALE